MIKINLIKWIQGARYTDAPIRLLLFFVAISGLTPNALETRDIPYQILYYASIILIIFNGFFPLITSFLSTLLFIAFIILYSNLINPFLIPILIGLSLLIGRSKYFYAGLISIILIVLYNIQILILENSGNDIFLLIFSWALALGFGLGIGYVERLISKQVAQRNATIIESKRNLAQAKMRLALDAHDAVSHGLTTQGAIISVMARRENLSPLEHRELGELAIVNAQTQTQLRSLLARLTTSDSFETRLVDFQFEFKLAVSGIQSAMKVGKFEIDINIFSIPDTADPTFLTDSVYVLQEMITNMVRYSSKNYECQLFINYKSNNKYNFLEFISINPSVNFPNRIPSALSRRSVSRGGYCSMRWCDVGLLEVKVTLPLG